MLPILLAGVRCVYNTEVLSPRQAWSSIREDMNRRFIQAKLVSSSLILSRRHLCRRPALAAI